MCRAHSLVGDGLSLGMDIGFGNPKILRSPSSISEPWIAPQKSRSFENDVLPREFVKQSPFTFLLSIIVSIIHHIFMKFLSSVYYPSSLALFSNFEAPFALDPKSGMIHRWVCCGSHQMSWHFSEFRAEPRTVATVFKKIV